MEVDQVEDMGSLVKSAVDDLRERVYNLKLFDGTNEINTYCDDLQSQIIVTVESLIKKINEFQKEMLDEISSYRSRLINPEVEVEDSNDHDSFKLELTRLSEDVEAFRAKCSAFYSQQSIESQEFQAILNKADEFKRHAKEARRQLRRLAFQGEFLKFNEDIFGFTKNESTSCFEICSQDVEDEMKVKHFSIDQSICKASVMRPFKKSDLLGGFSSLLFLADGNLAVARIGKPVSIVSLESCKELFELQPVIADKYMEEVQCMVQLDNQLIGGTFNGMLIFWDLETKHFVKTLNLNHRVRRIETLPNKNIVCLRGFRIVVVDLNQDWLPLEIDFFCIEKEFHFEILSNGNLAAINDKGIMSIFSLETGATLQTIVFPVSIELIQRILPNGDAVARYEDGTIQLLSVESGKLSRTLLPSQGRVMDVLRQSDDSLLVVHLWSKYYGLNIKDSAHFDRRSFTVRVEAYACSPDSKWLVVGCENGETLMFWPLDDLAVCWSSIIEPDKQSETN